MIDLYPTKCNLCGGKVVYISNAKIYGKQYGSVYCYHCTDCNAYVGTHEPRPKEALGALGILANKEMREWKMKCHGLFDPLWKNKRKKRSKLYLILAFQMGIPIRQCHFGYFDLAALKKHTRY